MKRQTSITFLAVLSLLVILAVMLLVKPLAQNLAYHNFADRRTFFGIPNFCNVISNLPFVFIGLYGLLLMRFQQVPFAFRVIYACVFTGIGLTGFGSAYYHLSPANDTLVWDRLPMVIIFMSFLAAVIAEWISLTAGLRLLIPLLLTGIASVAWWYFTELRGVGDMRLYIVVQYYPMLLIPLIFLFFQAPGGTRGMVLLLWVIAWYILAKLAETFDDNLYRALHLSGHTIKHLLAAIATWYVVLFYGARHLLQKPGRKHGP